MKKYKQLLDVILLLGLGMIALLAIAPKTFVMPSSIQMLILAAVLGLIATFLVLFWREQPDDEREMQNQALASRSAYIVGSLVLITALIIQSLHHNLDPAIPIALLAMIATKIIVQRTRDGK
jgi:cobalamin synthase